MNWLFQKITDLTDDQYAAIYSRVSPSRKARVDGLKKAADKKRSLLAAALVEKLLAEEGVHCASLENDAQGRPFLSGCDLFVSISHSGEGVACAVSRTPVGIDLEQIKPVRKSLVDYICLPGERSYVLQHDVQDIVTDPKTLHRFFEVWTAKEACFKKQPGQVLLQIDTLPLSKTIHLKEDFLITIL